MFFRREFQLPADLASAVITVVCDDEHQLFVNGVELGTGVDWKTPRSCEVLAHLKPGGRNVIAVEGRKGRKLPPCAGMEASICAQDGASTSRARIS